MLEQKGKVLAINRGLEKKDFKWSEIIIDTGAMYGNTVMFQCIKEGEAKIAGVKVGDEVNIKFFLNGNEWNGRYFVNLKLDDLSVITPAANNIKSTEAPQKQDEPIDDDLPF